MRARGAAAGSSRCYTITCGRDGGEPRHPRSPALPSREHRHPRSRAIALPRRAPASPDPGCSLAGGVGRGVRGETGSAGPRLSHSPGGTGIPGYHPPGAPASPAITLTGGHRTPGPPAIVLPGRRHPRLSPSPGGGHRTPAPRLLRSRGAGIPGYHPAGEHRLFPRHGAPAPLAPGCLPPHPPAGRLGGGTTTPASPVPGYPLLGEGGGAPAFPVPGCPSPRVAPVPATPLPRSRPGQRRTWGAGAGAGLGGGSGTGARRLADERRSCWGCPGRPLIAGAEPALGFLELRGFL